MQPGNTDTGEHRTAPPGPVLAAFAAIYLIWGSTYLGIRFAVETIPPFLLGGARFLLAGGVLYAWLRFRGVPNPAGYHWRNAALVVCPAGLVATSRRPAIPSHYARHCGRLCRDGHAGGRTGCYATECRRSS